MNIIRRFTAALATAALIALAVAPAAVLADDVQHGIGLTKGCASPVKIGDPYTCAYSVRNILDEAQDTLTINSLVDVVHAAGGDVNSGNIIGSVRINADGGATCTATGGDGSIGNPYTGVSECSLPFNGRVVIQPFTHYTVQAADFALPNHQLRDDVSLGWHDLCNDPAGTGNTNCNPNPPNNGASSLALIQQLGSSTATDIHNAAHQVVTSVPLGSTVHDFVTVTGQPGPPRRPAMSPSTGSTTTRAPAIRPPPAATSPSAPVARSTRPASPRARSRPTASTPSRRTTRVTPPTPARPGRASRCRSRASSPRPP